VKRFRSRRKFLFESCGGISGLGLALLLERDGLLAADCAAKSPAARKPHFEENQVRRLRKNLGESRFSIVRDHCPVAQGFHQQGQRTRVVATAIYHQDAHDRPSRKGSHDDEN
jgi:hypothetical protein